MAEVIGRHSDVAHRLTRDRTEAPLDRALEAAGRMASSVALLVIDLAGTQPVDVALARLAKVVRQDDHTLVLDDGRLALVAALTGIGSGGRGNSLWVIARRIEGALCEPIQSDDQVDQGGTPVRVGYAISPQDGDQASALLLRALKRLGAASGTDGR